jgi:hypothetical protein
MATTHSAAAWRLGRDHAENSASWLDIDSEDHARKLLALIEDGDPRVDEYFNAPNLSGEWSGDLTPQLLLEEIGAEDSDDGENLNRLCQRYEDGANHYWDLVERRLRKYLRD